MDWGNHCTCVVKFINVHVYDWWFMLYSRMFVYMLSVGNMLDGYRPLPRETHNHPQVAGRPSDIRLEGGRKEVQNELDMDSLGQYTGLLC